MTHTLGSKQEVRKLREVVEIVNVTDDGTALTNTPFIWNAKENVFYFKNESKIFEKISKRYGISMEDLNREFELRSRLLYELQKKKVDDFSQTQKIINEYHKNPSAVLSAFGIIEGKKQE